MDELPFALYLPLVAFLVGYLALYIAALVAGRRSGSEPSAKLLDLSFAVSLIASAYVVVLLLISVISLPGLIYDAVVITVVVAAFFGVLLFLLFGLFELAFSRGSRRASAARRD